MKKNNRQWQIAEKMATKCDQRRQMECNALEYGVWTLPATGRMNKITNQRGTFKGKMLVCFRLGEKPDFSAARLILVTRPSVT